ncbi:proton-coupled folate transporter-like isoform X2 [Athalia rosae]|uniref:proton-coupled folate transporter-like isoform X2 n=1 Tax=Athalia rosae TaxID=37344 RepID=UPI0020347978|nr:proton-coupled folate transporter-like isoform X2 [Athalia rosae]
MAIKNSHAASESEEETEVQEDPGFCQSYFGWIRHATVEPTMWLYVMAFMINSVVEQSFFIYKSCLVDHGLSVKTCETLAENDTLQAQVQVTVANFLQWNNVAAHVVPIILALFSGSWSDRRGRKIPLIIALFGKVIYFLMMAVNSVMDSWNLNRIIYTATLPMAMFGSDIAIFASSYSYLTDVSSSAQRTLRLTILDAIYYSTVPGGVAVGLYLFTNVVNSSYTIMFLINATLMLLSLIYSAARLQVRTTPQQRPLGKGENIIGDFFDREHIIASIKTLIKSRPGHRKLCLWILLLATMLFTFEREEFHMTYLYTQRVFSWSMDSFSQWRMFQSTLFISAMLIGVPILSKYLRMRDELIAIIGSFFHALARIIIATTTLPGFFYVGSAIAALGYIRMPVQKSMISKIVPVSERGKLFAFSSVCEHATPLISGFLYSQVYNATIYTAPESIYWLVFFTQITVLLMLVIIYVLLGKQQVDADNIDDGEACPDKPKKLSQAVQMDEISRMMD